MPGSKHTHIPFGDYATLTCEILLVKATTPCFVAQYTGACCHATRPVITELEINTEMIETFHKTTVNSGSKPDTPETSSSCLP